MRTTVTSLTRWRLLGVALAALLAAGAAVAADHAALERDARAVYGKLLGDVPEAKALSATAAAVLVFPKITKAGLVVGRQPPVPI